MKRYITINILLLLFLCATVTGGICQTLYIDDTFTFSEAGLHLNYLTGVDPDTGIDEIVKRYNNHEFKPSTSVRPSFGYSTQCLWLSLTVTNTTSLPVQWLLEYDYPLIDAVTLYIPHDHSFTAIQTGDKLSFSYRQFPYRTFVFPIVQKPGATTYFMRVQSQGSLVVALKAWTLPAFEKMLNKTLPFIWMHYGLMIALFFYNLFLFITVRDKSFLYLVLFIVGVTLFAMANNGIAAQYLWPESTWWGNVCHPFFIFFAMVGIVLFTREFLNLPVVIPVLGTVLLIIAIVTAMGGIIPFVAPYYYATQISVLMAAIEAVIVITAGIVAQIKKVREALYFNVATLSFVAGVILIVLRSFGVLGDNFFTAWGYQLGSSAMVILFSLGIADKVNTWRKDKERALSQLATSEAKYRTLVENAHDGIMLVQDWNIVYSNNALARMLGYTVEELLNKNINVITADSSLGREVLIQYENRMLGKTAKLQYEAQLKRKTGTVMDVLISAQKVILDGISTSIAIITDISSLKEAHYTIQQQYEEIQSQYEELEAMNEEMVRTHYELTEATHNLEEEKERLHATLRSIYDAVIATDIQGNIIIINARAEQLLGNISTEVIGNQFVTVFPLRYTTREAFKNPVNEILRYGLLDTAGEPLVLQLHTKEIIVELSGAPIYVEGKIIGTVIVLHDITQQYWLEKEMHKISKLESLSILAGGIAHDFNNLLTAIIGNVSILKMKLSENIAYQKYIERIENAAQRAVDLTKQLLTFSKGGEPIKAVASLEQLITDTTQFVFSGSNVRCDLDIQPDLWSSEVDIGQISQVFQNIMINAMQSMPQGGIVRIKAHNYVYDGKSQKPLLPGDYIAITIKDEGIGIPKENLSKIFDPFFTIKEHGSGLGLATSYSIIKRHGGYIEVTSDVGEGSEFIIYLHATHEKNEEKKEASASIDSYEGKILLMDDDFTIYEVVSHMLDMYGFTVDWVESGEKAITKYQTSFDDNNPYDIVIMDLTVPGAMGGAQATKEILRINPDAKVIVSSGYSNDPIMSHYKEYGFKGVIAKPYRIEEIMNVINELMKQ
ncbi:MAG TPA: 7TM diverse intracellular signaling domain-containing protein [Spirochaetota bacterium]|nr:7TM diverse intracellular signaling domain-containing protein [Spirochaetota bacterium]